MECRHFLETMTAKISECCPLKHELVPVISRICPQTAMHSQVYDAVRNAGGALSVEISKTMIQYVHGTRSRYVDVLEKMKAKLLVWNVRTVQIHSESELKLLLANKAKL